MDHSEASVLLSSNKFQAKAQDLLKVCRETSPRHISLEKKFSGAGHKDVSLEGPTKGAGGMMLYTSGTTNRPVCN